MSNFKLKNSVNTAFRLNGLTLRAEASRYLVDILTPIAEDEREQWLEKLIDLIQKQGLTSSAVEKSHVEAAAKECSKQNTEDPSELFNVISAFDFPRFTYVTDKKKYLPAEALGAPPPSLLASAKAKAEMYRHRYALIHQRTSRHHLFTPPVLGEMSDESTQKYQLRPIEYLLGSTVKLESLIVLGMLSQLKEGTYFLQDLTGSVPLNLADTKFHTGLYTENCFVLAEGWYEDGTFHINAMGFPPPEPAKITRAYFGNANFFGGASVTSVKVSGKLKAIEAQNTDAMMVFLSDIWLDKPKVLEKLRVLFAGFAEIPPLCFVLMGNFLSSPQNTSHDVAKLKKLFKTLGEIISDFPLLAQQSKFVFIPGPTDPGFANIAPKPAFPKSITEEFTKKVPKAIFGSNPTRIQYCSQELVFYREDVITKMARNAVYFPTSGDIPNHFGRSLVSQSHLSPIPSHICPTHWAWNYTLDLYPLPDVVVLADKWDPFTVTQCDCSIVNPGSFSRNGFSFKVYVPATGAVEDSQVTETD